MTRFIASSVTVLATLVLVGCQPSRPAADHG